MKLELKRFGTNLTSRPNGKEDYLGAKAYSLPKDLSETIEVDFDGVEVLTPSWADEFITPLMADRPGKVVLLPSRNATVKASLEII